jgi:hypothetical protein
MSKQFQLYLTPSDALALVKELRVRFGARVLSEKCSTSDPVELDSPLRHESIFSASGATSIRCYLAPANGRIITDYYPTLRRWLIQTSSEAIEFCGCDFDGKTLLVGRFYFQTDDLVDGRIVKRRAEFLQWADTVFRYTKKALKRDRELMKPLGAYVGKEALVFRESGVRFADSIKEAGVPISPRPGSSASPSRVVH